MDHRKTRQVVNLQQREGRARNLDGLVRPQGADDGAGQGGFAGAEVAGKRHEVAGLQRRGDVNGKTPGRVLIGQDDVPSRARRIGGQHQPSLFGGFAGSRGVDRKYTGYDRTTAGLGIDGNAAAMERHQRAHDRQAKTGAAMA